MRPCGGWDPHVENHWFKTSELSSVMETIEHEGLGKLTNQLCWECITLLGNMECCLCGIWQLFLTCNTRVSHGSHGSHRVQASSGRLRAGAALLAEWRLFSSALSPATLLALLCHHEHWQIVALLLCASASLPHCGYCWVFPLLVKQNSTHVWAILGHFPWFPKYHRGSPEVLELRCLPAGFVSGTDF